METETEPEAPKADETPLKQSVGIPSTSPHSTDHAENAECTCHENRGRVEVEDETSGFIHFLRSCRYCCWILCCPPVPSSIAAKIAFTPPVPTYSMIRVSKPSSHKNDKKSKKKGDPEEPPVWEMKILDEDLKDVTIKTVKDMRSVFQCFVCRSRRGNRVAGAYIKCVSNPRFVLLYSHGNAVDLGIMATFYHEIGTTLECDVVSYDYSGYGASSGKASEANLYADIEAVWAHCVKTIGIDPHRIIIYGQSIGTVSACHLATKVLAAGVVLQAPLTSGLRMVRDTCYNDQRKAYCCDVFPNVNAASRITSPVLVIHGTHDEIIPVSHGRCLHDQCPLTVEPLWVNGAGHNGLELYPSVFRRLKRFINDEIPSLLRETDNYRTLPDLARTKPCTAAVAGAGGAMPPKTSSSQSSSTETRTKAVAPATTGPAAASSGATPPSTTFERGHGRRKTSHEASAEVGDAGARSLRDSYVRARDPADIKVEPLDDDAPAVKVTGGESIWLRNVAGDPSATGDGPAEKRPAAAAASHHVGISCGMERMIETDPRPPLPPQPDSDVSDDERNVENGFDAAVDDVPIDFEPDVCVPSEDIVRS